MIKTKDRLSPDEIDDIVFNILKPSSGGGQVKSEEEEVCDLMHAMDTFLDSTHPPTLEERELIERDEHVQRARDILAKAEWLCK